MKKFWIVGLLLVVAAVASSPYWLGEVARIGYTDQIHALSGLSGLPARVNRYDNGYLSASAESTVTLPDPDSTDGGTIDLVLDHTVRHGPVVLDGPGDGEPVFAAAVIETVPRLPEGLDTGLRANFGGELPVRLETVVDFSGNAITYLSGGPFASPGGNGAPGVTWEGFKGVMHVSRDGRAWRVEADAPALRLTDDEERMAIIGIRLESNGVIADDGLYLGDGELHAGTLLFLGSPAHGVAGDFELRDVTIRSEQLPDGEERLKYTLTLETGPGRADGSGFDSMEGEVRLQGLDRATIAALQKRLDAFEAAGGGLPDDWLAREIDAVIAEHGADFIAASPELTIPRLGIVRNGERSDARLRLALKGEALAGISPDVAMSQWETLGPFLLLGAIEGELDLDVPGKLMDEALSSQTAIGAAEAGDVLESLVQQGYVERSGGRVKTSVRLASGAITLNDKPFNPLMLGGLAGE
ncbi:MAG: DUF945 family protein [Pseudomonadota bacterium]|nr:DUF945 family protein [Pseudomonadota bacterium]